MSYSWRDKCRRIEMLSLFILVIMSVSDVLRAHSRFVKFVGAEPPTHFTPTFGPKYVSNRPYNEFIWPTTFI